MREWVTVAEAAALTGRSARTIYDWVERDVLASRLNTEGVTEVLSKAAVRIAGSMKRGRPRGVPTRR